MKRFLSWMLIFCSILSLPISQPLVASAESYTPVFTRNWRGHTYHLYDASLTWKEAKAYCETIGGHLVTIKTKDEQNIIESIVNNSKKNLIWIGLYRANDTWNWITNEEFHFSNWAKGEPNNDFSGAENVVQLYAKKNGDHLCGEWNDSKNDSGTADFYRLRNVGFICEFDLIDNVIVGRSATTKQITLMKNNKDMTDNWDEYTACEDAKISVEGKTYKTNKNGTATVPSAGTAVVKYEGYYDETVDLGSIMNGDKIYLEKTGMNTPVLRAVKVNGTDIRHNEGTVPADYNGNITAEIDWNGNTEYETYISNGISVWQMTNGNTGTIALGKEFNPSSDISITIKTKNGYSVSKKLHLKVSKTNVAGEEINLSFGDGFRNIGSGIIPYFDDMKFDFDIPNFPVELSIDGNKVRGVFGVDVAEWAYENGMFDGKKGEWATYDDKKKQQAFMSLTELIKNTKQQIEKNKSDEQSIKEQYKELEKKLGKSKITGEGKFGFDAGISATGFVEGTIDQNGIYFSGGGIILSAEAKVGISGSGALVVVVVPVPYNWEASLKGSIEAQLAIAQRELRSQNLSPSGTIKGTVELKVGAGPGFKKFHANIVGKGSISPAYTLSALQNAFTLDAKLGAYLELTAGRFTKLFELAEADFRLYPRKTMSIASIASEEELYEPEGFGLMGREYLDAPQEFTANDIMLFAASEFGPSQTETVIKTNTYTMPQPQSVLLSDGRELIVWVDDDTDADTINGTNLMYTVYDGGSYTEPEFVERNGMADYEPQLKVIGDTAYLAWEETSAALAADADVSEAESTLEIKYAVFDGEAFTDITRLTENDYSDSMPHISNVNGDAVITWVGNEGGFMSEDKVYSVNYAYIGGEPAVLADQLYPVDSHAAVEYDGDLAAVFAMDTDSDIGTVSDNELFYAYGGAAARITDDDVPQTGISEYGGTVYFNNNGELSILADGGITGLGIALSDDNYTVLDGGDMVCITDGDGAEREIYAYIRYGDKYGNAVRLTELDGNITDVTGFTAEDGAVKLTFRKRSIEGDLGENIGSLFGRTDVARVILYPSYSVSLDHAYIDKSTLKAGENIPIELEVTNSGENPVFSIDAALYDADGSELAAENIETELLPGETGNLIFGYTLPDSFEAFDGVVKISVDDEYDESDNAYELRFDYIDIAVDSADFTATEDGYVINAAVSNNGLRAGNAVINLIKDNEIIASETVSTLAALDTYMVSFEGVDPHANYIVEAEDLENETMIGNNAQIVAAMKEDTSENEPTEKPDGDWTYKIDGIHLYSNEAETAKNDIDGEFDISVNVTAMQENVDGCILASIYNDAGKLIYIVHTNTISDEVLFHVPVLAEPIGEIKVCVWQSLDRPLPLAASVGL